MRARIKHSCSLVFTSGHYHMPRKKSEKDENKQSFLLTIEINFPTIFSSGTSQNRNGKPGRRSMRFLRFSVFFLLDYTGKASGYSSGR